MSEEKPALALELRISQLNSLMADPHPGLGTWVTARNAAAELLYAELGNLLGKPPGNPQPQTLEGVAYEAQRLAESLPGLTRLSNTREAALVRTKLEEAAHWAAAGAVRGA